MKEKTSMQEMIKKNHEQAHREYTENLRRSIQKQEKQNKKEKILFYFIAAFIIAITCKFIFLYDKQGKKFVETCTDKGYSVNYCMNHM